MGSVRELKDNDRNNIKKWNGFSFFKFKVDSIVIKAVLSFSNFAVSKETFKTFFQIVLLNL